jgi:hypothetical protein
MNKIAAALVKAQKGFAPALKTNTNPHFKSKYADLSACVEAVIDSLNDAGIALIQPCHECDNGVTVETLFVHESGETMSGGKIHVPAAKQDPQGYGSALTYARRYGLMSACGIAPEDDDGNAASKPAPRQKAESAKTVSQVEWESMDTESQAFLRGIANDVKGYLALPDVKQAVERLNSETLDSDEKTAIWYLFDSKERSAIKKYQEEQRNQVKEAA